MRSKLRSRRPSQRSDLRRNSICRSRLAHQLVGVHIPNPEGMSIVTPNGAHIFGIMTKACGAYSSLKEAFSKLLHQRSSSRLPYVQARLSTYEIIPLLKKQSILLNVSTLPN